MADLSSLDTNLELLVLSWSGSSQYARENAYNMSTVLRKPSGLPTMYKKGSDADYVYSGLDCRPYT